ncbi:Hsp20/alpha crystallin family protein [Candidatus Latescibacterota bacterium]
MLPDLWRNRGSLLAPTMDDFVERFFCGWPSFVGDRDLTWNPRTDVNETDKEITIDVEVPGLKKSDVKVEVKNNVLTISGERKKEEKTKNPDYSRIERHFGRFERSFGLPDTVQTDKIAAAYKEGVLTLTLPKTEKAIPKEIAIDVK